MTDNEHTQSTDRAPDALAQLVKLAGERAEPAPERVAQNYAAVRAHWQREVQARRDHQPEVLAADQRHWQSFAVAASIMIAAVAVFALRPGTPAVHVGTVAMLMGEVIIDGRPASADMRLADNAVLRTGEGRAAVRMASGHQLRVDTHSIVRLDNTHVLHLEQGALYLDSGTRPLSQPVSVHTAYGLARDIGTQFQVRVEEGAIAVAVREGLVELHREGISPIRIATGTQLSVDRATQMETRPISPTDPLWGWTEEIAPPFRFEGATVDQYLQWFARERGLQVVYEDQGLRDKVYAAYLHGSFERARPEAALSAVCKTSAIVCDIVEDELRVRRQPAADSPDKA